MFSEDVINKMIDEKINKAIEKKIEIMMPAVTMSINVLMMSEKEKIFRTFYDLLHERDEELLNRVNTNLEKYKEIIDNLFQSYKMLTEISLKQMLEKVNMIISANNKRIVKYLKNYYKQKDLSEIEVSIDSI